MQYSIANLNAFIILISIGYTYYIYINNNNEDNDYKKLLDKNNSPIQLISQLKGYFSINPVLSISLIITIYSLVGIPPLVGFFGKQMVLSAALDNGYIFIVLVAILTSVISAVYYLNIVKQIFFDKSDYEINPQIKDSLFIAGIKINENKNKKITFKINNIVLSNSLTITISYLTLIILLFIFNPQE
jgi:NADH-ubiquinone oxidoreductase chain 2